MRSDDFGEGVGTGKPVASLFSDVERDEVR